MPKNYSELKCKSVFNSQWDSVVLCFLPLCAAHLVFYFRFSKGQKQIGVIAQRQKKKKQWWKFSSWCTNCLLMNQWWQRESTKRAASKGSSGFTGWNTMAIQVHGMEQKEIWLVLIWGQILLLETEGDFIGGWGISYLDDSQSSGGVQDSSRYWKWLDKAGLHRCTDHGSAGKSSKHKIYYTTARPKVQFVQRCSGNNSAHYRRVQDAGRQGTQYMEHHSQVAGIGYRKICAP